MNLNKPFPIGTPGYYQAELKAKDEYIEILKREVIYLQAELAEFNKKNEVIKWISLIGFLNF